MGDSFIQPERQSQTQETGMLTDGFAACWKMRRTDRGGIIWIGWKQSGTGTASGRSWTWALSDTPLGRAHRVRPSAGCNADSQYKCISMYHLRSAFSVLAALSECGFVRAFPIAGEKGPHRPKPWNTGPHPRRRVGSLASAPACCLPLEFL